MNWKEIFESFKSKKILVIGDVMVDAYTFGKVERISPEAPVPVVTVTRNEQRLGGAANVGLNLKALGADPIILGSHGNDSGAEILKSLFVKAGLSTDGLVAVDNRPTTIKTRIIGNNAQMLRIDEENDHLLPTDSLKKVLEKVKYLLNKYQFSAILFEDYDKGLLSGDLIQDISQLAKEKNIPIAVDPKKRNFMAYHHVDLFKPNLKELKEGLNIQFSGFDKPAIIDALNQLHTQLGHKLIMVTLSEHGVVISDKEKQTIDWIPAFVRNISDVSGAGDTVISVSTLALAAQLSPKNIAALSNLAGGMVCEKIGVVPIQPQELLNEAEKLLN